MALLSLPPSLSEAVDELVLWRGEAMASFVGFQLT